MQPTCPPSHADYFLAFILDLFLETSVLEAFFSLGFDSRPHEMLLGELAPGESSAIISFPWHSASALLKSSARHLRRYMVLLCKHFHVGIPEAQKDFRPNSLSLVLSFSTEHHRAP